jgi:hypothetical protein
MPMSWKHGDLCTSLLAPSQIQCKTSFGHNIIKQCVFVQMGLEIINYRGMPQPSAYSNLTNALRAHMNECTLFNNIMDWGGRN